MTAQERLLSHVDRSGPSVVRKGRDLGPCWLWQGRLTRGGYGQVKYKGRACRAHRVAYELWRKRIRRGRVLLHVCDTPACINPDHLKPGTQLQNVRDMVRKGRHNFYGRINAVRSDLGSAAVAA